jgi:hypothetical protein
VQKDHDRWTDRHLRDSIYGAFAVDNPVESTVLLVIPVILGLQLVHLIDLEHVRHRQA